MRGSRPLSEYGNENLARARLGLVFAQVLALGAEVVLIMSAMVGGQRRVARKVPLFVAPIAAQSLGTRSYLKIWVAE
eukprot:2353081-Alexandrium_andersonii.AAC.1